VGNSYILGWGGTAVSEMLCVVLNFFFWFFVFFVFFFFFLGVRGIVLDFYFRHPCCRGTVFEEIFAGWGSRHLSRAGSGR